MAQKNQSRADRTKLENILDRCYKYVGSLPYTGEAPDDQEGDLFSDCGPKPKLYKRPQHRPEGRVDLAEKVRYEVANLMKVLDNDEDDPDDDSQHYAASNPTLGPPLKKMLVTVSPAGLKLWRERLITGPSVEDFVLQLDAGVYTEWNKAAAVVFCEYFCSKEDYHGYKRDDVRQAFMRRITQLKRDFKNQGQQKKLERLDEERRARRLARRRMVRNLRHTCEYYSHPSSF